MMANRIVFVLGAVLAAAWLLGGVAYADHGPHGNYSALTDACAGCHRAHTASYGRLLVGGPTISDFCLVCHGSTGSGADTNVADGVYLERDGDSETPAEGGPDSFGLKGGGFLYALMATDWLTTTASPTATTTSSHLADGSLGTAWGHGAIGSGAGSALALSCTSCHDPHGGASTTGGPTYRLLRSTLPITGSTGVDVADEAFKFYTVSDTALKSGDQYFGENYGTRGEQLSDWCSQCHTRYLAQSGSGHTDSGDSTFAYRHMSKGLGCGCHTEPGPFNSNPTGGPFHHSPVDCVTCHVAHGSSASMGAYSGSIPWPDGSTSPSGDNRSSLLRVDKRGVCQLCHGK